MQNDSLSTGQLIDLMGYSALTKQLKVAFGNLLKLELIQYTIPDKLKSKNQKYVITKLGVQQYKLLSQQG